MEDGANKKYSGKLYQYADEITDKKGQESVIRCETGQYEFSNYQIISLSPSHSLSLFHYCLSPFHHFTISPFYYLFILFHHSLCFIVFIIHFSLSLLTINSHYQHNSQSSLSTLLNPHYQHNSQSTINTSSC